MSLLNIPVVAHMRGNHALEHATMHLLVRNIPDEFIIARSTPKGFTLYGRVETEEVEQAVQEALSRLKAGQHYLAIHPNCGTNVATGGILAGFGAFLALEVFQSKSRWERLSQLLWGAVLGVLIAQPLGRWAQAKLTTSVKVGQAQIGRIISERQGGILRHTVEVHWE